MTEAAVEIQSDTQGIVLLRKRFPVSGRFIVKKTISWFLLGVFFVALYFWLRNPANPFSAYTTETAPQKFAILSIVFWAIFLGKLAYAYLYRETITYGIEDGFFLLKKGVLLKDNQCVPLTSITNTYLKQNFLDACLGLHTLTISTANDDSDDNVLIEGLSNDIAKSYHRYMRNLLNEFQASRKDIQGLEREVREVRSS